VPAQTGDPVTFKLATSAGSVETQVDPITTALLVIVL
jgi:hypothetical protein